MEIVLAIALIAAVAVIGALVISRRQPVAPAPIETPLPEAEPQPARLADDEVTRIVAQLRAEVSQTQASALKTNTDQFLALAEQRLRQETNVGEERLKARQAEIDKSLKGISETLKDVTGFVQETDKRRNESIVQLSTVVTQSQRSLQDLASVTQNLNQALTSGQQRGQWGERMAEDILRTSGLIEDINYRRNARVEGGMTRPDFTFLLPQDRVLHMDVKFPLAGYLRFLQAETDPERDIARKQFLSDVRQRLREVTGREYIDTSNGTLDYVLVFIPNEQVYGFIHEQDPQILDEALAMRVVLCSPLTLFAVLAVIRQSVENFRLSEQTDRILSALGGFAKQWEKYQTVVDKVGTRLASTQKAFDDLAHTRTNQLERQVRKVETLRLESGVAAVESVLDQVPLVPGVDESVEGSEVPAHLLNES